MWVSFLDFISKPFARISAGAKSSTCVVIIRKCIPAIVRSYFLKVAGLVAPLLFD
jgi:hypothetical protein